MTTLSHLSRYVSKSTSLEQLSAITTLIELEVNTTTMTAEIDRDKWNLECAIIDKRNLIMRGI